MLSRGGRVGPRDGSGFCINVAETRRDITVMFSGGGNVSISKVAGFRFWAFNGRVTAGGQVICTLPVVQMVWVLSSGFCGRVYLELVCERQIKVAPLAQWVPCLRNVQRIYGPG